VDEAGITGLSVALVDDQEMVWSEGFGYADKANGVAATPDTLYMVASISKLFTASAIMQLAEAGKIDIDQPVQTYVPEFSINSRFPEAGPITPRTLMTHHAGLPSDITNGMLAFGDDLEALTISEFQDMVQEIKQAHVTNPPTPVSPTQTWAIACWGTRWNRLQARNSATIWTPQFWDLWEWTLHLSRSSRA